MNSSTYWEIKQVSRYSGTCCVQGNKVLVTTYLFLIEHVIVGYDILNLIDGVVRLLFCEGTLLLEQGNVDTS